MYVLKKETKRRSYQLGTGGGSPLKIDFSLLEEELLAFLTPEAAGLENIPQGGLNLYEHASSCQEEMLSLDNMDHIQTQDPQSSENHYLPPCKKLRTSNVILNNYKGL